MKKSDRQKVFDKYGGRCAYCGCELNEHWQVDHGFSKNHWMLYDPSDPNKVNDFENLYPACKECNHYKRSHCIDSSCFHIGFREYMSTFHKRLARLPKKTMRDKTAKTKLYMQAIADRYGITHDKPFDSVFYFEKVNSEPLK